MQGRLVNKIQELHDKGKPILIGTASVDASETLSRMLKRAKIPHEVLNAKNHQREAEIVAQAGKRGAVTVSTNMAGRGTDIKLGEGVADLGGLFVLGTERHESRRIDRQRFTVGYAQAFHHLGHAFRRAEVAHQVVFKGDEEL